MPTETIDTLIIGAGLSGIYAAHLLAAKKRPFLVLEARGRMGGRILCQTHRGYCSDLGPSWYWPDIHPKMRGLISALGLTGFRQYEDGHGRFQGPECIVHTVRGLTSQPPSWRLCGGMADLVEKLCQTLPEKAVRFHHPVCMIEKVSDGAVVSVGELDQEFPVEAFEPRARFHARKVILALPPRLAAASILFEPDLPHNLAQAMLKTGTWMAGQAKFCALYEKPFWRQNRLSGEAFSQRGPLGEIHDGSANGKGPYALTGFVGVPAARRKPQEGLVEAIVDQLAAIFGEADARPTAFFFQDWARERFTATTYDQPPMVEHPVYSPPAGQACFWAGTVHFAGTETADQHGGYLEGALAAARRAVASL